ncbi:MAG: FapA family protein, partial [Bacilli bacterium]
VFDKHQNVSVLPVYHVQRDVDFSTGNIDFVGSVRVAGSVRSGFTVKAKGNIDVHGIVEAASLEASGSIVIRGGVQGSSRCKIAAGASVQAQYLQNATVEAEGNVTVSDSIMNSSVSGYGVFLTGKRGLLVGGVTQAKTRISVRTAGSQLAVPTRFELWPDGELNLKVYRCSELLREGLDTLAKIGEALVRLQVIERQQGALPAEQSAVKERLEATYTQLHMESVRLGKERDRAAQDAGLLSPAVDIADVAHPGVHLVVGHIEHQLQETASRCTFVVTGDGWTKRPRT